MTIACTETLGPYKRYAIWVQGCNKRCPGCISEDSRPLDGGYEVDTDDLVESILQTSGIEGLTISGGEPFLQSEALSELINKVKLKRDIGAILYTGNDFEEIKEDRLTQLCDIIIDGAYIEDLNDGLSLRGSSNQIVRLLTDRYKVIARKMYGVQGRKIELHFFKNRTTMVGIPDRKSLSFIRKKQEV